MDILHLQHKMKNKNIFWMVTLLTIMVVFSNIILAFEVPTIGGGTMEWEESFCLEDPANYMDLVGDDYYLYCESGFDNQVIVTNYDIENTSLPVQDVIDEDKEIIFGVQNNSKNLSEVDNLDVLIQPDSKENNWQLFVIISGLVLLLITTTLILAHLMIIRRDEKKQLSNLTPYINNLMKKGYTKDQIEHLLIDRGYQSSFINKLLNKK